MNAPRLDAASFWAVSGTLGASRETTGVDAARTVRPASCRADALAPRLGREPPNTSHPMPPSTANIHTRKDRATPTSDPPKLATETSTSHNVGHHRYWELPVRTCTSLDEEA